MRVCSAGEIAPGSGLPRGRKRFTQESARTGGHIYFVVQDGGKENIDFCASRRLRDCQGGGESALKSFRGESGCLKVFGNAEKVFI